MELYIRKVITTAILQGCNLVFIQCFFEDTKVSTVKGLIAPDRARGVENYLLGVENLNISVIAVDSCRVTPLNYMEGRVYYIVICTTQRMQEVKYTSMADWLHAFLSV